MYVTPIYITELFHFVTYAELFLITVKVNSWLTQNAKLTLIRLVTTMRFNCKATPTNDTDYRYSCHLKAVELVQSIKWAPYLSASHH